MILLRSLLFWLLFGCMLTGTLVAAVFRRRGTPNPGLEGSS